jgi:hypothetical protein
MRKETIVKIWDCRHQDLMILKRVGGDLSIAFNNKYGKNLFVEWYQLKKPHKANFEKAVILFSELKNILMRQNEEE